MLVWHRERNAGRSDDEGEAVSATNRVECCTLLPQLLLFDNLLRDLLIAPSGHSLLGQKAKVDAPFARRNLAKLARLPTQAPEPHTFGHFLLGCRSVMQERIGPQHIIIEWGRKTLTP